MFHGQYLPSLRTNYVTINKDLEKFTTTAVLDKDEICYDQRYDVIRVVVIATK